MAKLREYMGSGLWLVPLTAVLTVLAAWFIAYTVAQDIAEQDRYAFDRARVTQVATCERANVLREETNKVVDILDEFLLDASSARESAGSDIDIGAAESYRQLAGELTRLTIVDCEEVVPNFLDGR